MGLLRVSFKSTPENFQKEFSGKKNNTVRKVDPEDERFISLKSGIAEEISIINTNDESDWFYRKIKDVTWWEDLCIITWYLEVRV